MNLQFQLLYPRIGQLLPFVLSAQWSHNMHTQNNYLLSNAGHIEEVTNPLPEEPSLLHYPLTQEEKYEGDEVASTNLPSVTRVLSQTKPVENQLMLSAWKNKMIAKLGEEGFTKMQQGTLSAGSRCHSVIEQRLSGIPVEDIAVEESCAGLWRSVQPVLDDVTGVTSIEGKFVHPHLKYYGYVDCVAEYKGQLCSIDWKTSQKKRYSLSDCYDDPLQVAAYAGAVNCAMDSNNQISHGLVVKIYYNGEPASPFFMNSFALEFFWMKWLKRLAAYKALMKNNDKVT